MKLASFERSQTSQGSKSCFIQLGQESVQSAAEKQGQSCGLIHMMKLLSFFPSFFQCFAEKLYFILKVIYKYTAGESYFQLLVLGGPGLWQ